jgi:beta-fructofuranosidase
MAMTVADRPRIHLTPATGWMNDPHGLTVHQGRLHVFYQAEPNAPRWGRMSWGHASSADFLRWDHLPIAIAPDDGTADAFGCWSGCLVRDRTGRPTIFYTGVSKRRGKRHAAICMATSDPNLATWVKAAAPPIIPGAPRGFQPDMFRDPFVWQDERDWAMIVGAGTTRGRGAVLLYRSDDLRDWRYVGPFLATEGLVESCPDLDVAEIDGPCWECPQLIQLGSRALLILSIVDRSPVVRPAHVVAVTGRVTEGRFVPERAERLGLGPDFYAPSTCRLPDGNHLLFGWIPEDPPRRGETRSWAGSLTLPRVVSLDDEGRPIITLAAETERLGHRIATWADILVTDSEPFTIAPDNGHAEVRLRIAPDRAAPIRIDIRAVGRLVAEIRFDPRSRRLTVARIERVTVAGRDPSGTTALPPSTTDALDLRIILDGSILEVVAMDRVTATVRLPAVGSGARQLSLTTFGGSCRVTRAELFSIESEPDPGYTIT